MIGRIADNNATAPRNTLQPAGQVHLAAKHGVTEFLLGTHQTDRDRARGDSRTQRQQPVHRIRGLPGRQPRRIFLFAALIFGRALEVEFVNGTLGVDGGAHALQRMPIVWNRRAPKGQNTIADVFVERAVVLDDRVGDHAQIKTDRAQKVAGLLVQVSFRHRGRQLVLPDIRFGLGLHFIGHPGEPANVRKINRHLAPRAAERNPVRFQQFGDNIR